MKNINTPRIYHHHIPKTGGMYVKNLFQNTVVEQLKLKEHSFNNLFFYKIDKNNVQDYTYFSWHLGTDPYDIFSDIVSYTTLRNPIERIISHFFFGLKYFQNNKNYINSNNIDGLFLQWLENDDGIVSKNNFQARFLTTGMNSNDPLVFNKNDKTFWFENNKRVIHGWDIKQSDYSYDAAKKRLDSMAVCGTLENINKFNNNFIEYFSANYKINFNNIITDMQKVNVNNESQEWMIKLSKKYENKILELNEIDLALWEYLKNKN